MPKKATFPPQIRHNTKSGLARVRWHGVDYYLGAWGSEEAHAAYLELVARLSQGLPATAPEARAGDLVLSVWKAWDEQEGRQYSARGREREQFRQSVAPLLSLYGDRPAKEFDLSALEHVQRAMITGSWRSEEDKAELASRGEYPGWALSTINRRINRIRLVWRWAERKKLVPPGSWAALCALKPLRKGKAGVRTTIPRKPCSWADLVSVCREARPCVRDMLLLQWFTGMRSGEVRIMRPADIDRSGAVWLYRPQEHKCDWRGQERVIPLGPVCQKILAPYLKKCLAPQEWFFNPRREEEERKAKAEKAKNLPVKQEARRKRWRKRAIEPTRGQQPGEHYTTNTYAQAVQRAAARAGVVGFEAYQTRHAAKQRVKREHGLDAARALLGQKSVSTTEGYAEGIDLELAIRGAK